jgi:hypothetical protein
MSLRKAAFDARRPSKTKSPKRTDAETFVDGPGAGKERQNLWIEPELRLNVALQARKNGESISAFASRAFKRELADSTFVRREE